jgi:uncharacterized protein YdiU (UPF0061 family)
MGDGRAIILAEIENKEQVYTLQLKGAGMTSRRADGLAVLRSSIQHLCSEAMYHLGVPYPILIDPYGDQVLRDVMYDETRMKRRRRLQGSAIIHPFWKFRTIFLSK